MTSARMSWTLSPRDLLEQGVTSSLWRIAQMAFAALIAAIVPPITIAMLEQTSRRMHAQLANPKRKRKQAVNYPNPVIA